MSATAGNVLECSNVFGTAFTGLAKMPPADGYGGNFRLSRQDCSCNTQHSAYIKDSVILHDGAEDTLSCAPPVSLAAEVPALKDRAQVLSDRLGALLLEVWRSDGTVAQVAQGTASLQAARTAIGLARQRVDATPVVDQCFPECGGTVTKRETTASFVVAFARELTDAEQESYKAPFCTNFVANFEGAAATSCTMTVRTRRRQRRATTSYDLCVSPGA